jgi:hypothetical protein
LVSDKGHLAPTLGLLVSVQNDAFANFWRSDPGNLRQVFQVTISQNRLIDLHNKLDRSDLHNKLVVQILTCKN